MASRLSSVGLIGFSTFGGILYGYDTGVISGVIAMKDWLRTVGHSDPASPVGYAISSSVESFVVAAFSIGTLIGSLLGAPVADAIGRKRGIMSSCVVVCSGIALQVASTSVPLFIAGRVVSGIGIGLVCCLVPMYLSECSPKWCRGAVISVYQWFITLGVLLGTIVNNATHQLDHHGAYRIPISIQFVWAAVLGVGMSLLPESPRWLVLQRKEPQAARSLARIIGRPHDHPEITQYLLDIRSHLEQELALCQSSYVDCFRHSQNRIPMRMFTGILIQAFQQLTGINFIFYYNTTFFKKSGIQNNFLMSVVIGIVNVLFTVPGILGIERFGRRSLLLVGAAGMAVCHFVIAGMGVSISPDNVDGQRALIAFICIYIGFFASTWGCVPWVVVGEIFPLQVRAKAMSICMASNWIWNFLIAVISPYLVNDQPGSAGLGEKVFFIWGSTCFCGFVFSYFFVSETKGLSLEQIDLMYQSVSPLRSVEYNRRVSRENTSTSTSTNTSTEIAASDKFITITNDKETQQA